MIKKPYLRPTTKVVKVNYGDGETTKKDAWGSAW